MEKDGFQSIVGVENVHGLGLPIPSEMKNGNQSL